MNIRELARKAGGEKAVAEIDAAAKIEQIAAKQINEIIEATLKGKEGREEMLVLTALCEALSACLAMSSLSPRSRRTRATAPAAS